MTTLLFASESFILATAVARPFPMAVPSSMRSVWTSFIRLMRVARSVVRGHWVKLSPAKTTIPILSEGRWEMNSMAISFDALIRSGVRSRASILVETSIARIISIPSVSILSICSDDLGRAMARTIITRAKVLNRNGR